MVACLCLHQMTLEATPNAAIPLLASMMNEATVDHEVTSPPVQVKPIPNRFWVSSGGGKSADYELLFSAGAFFQQKVDGFSFEKDKLIIIKELNDDMK
jgi:hypothetical protein